MENFNGQYVKLNNAELSLSAINGGEFAAIEEVKIAKRILQLRKKELNEQMRIIRANASEKRAHQGPASLGFGALLFRGTKAGSFFRTMGSINRASDRSTTQSELAPYEFEKRNIEKFLIGIAQMELVLKKAVA
jgi:hypothetical protein